MKYLLPPSPACIVPSPRSAKSHNMQTNFILGSLQSISNFANISKWREVLKFQTFRHQAAFYFTKLTNGTYGRCTLTCHGIFRAHKPDTPSKTDDMVSEQEHGWPHPLHALPWLSATPIHAPQATFPFLKQNTLRHPCLQRQKWSH